MEQLQRVGEQDTSTLQQPNSTTNPFDYQQAWEWLEKKGKQVYGQKFRLHEEDSVIINTLLCYFLQDHFTASMLQINLNKGILLSGPIGCGKTSLMRLMMFLCLPKRRHVMKVCRDVSFEFINDGYEVLQRYGRYRSNTLETGILCFDDLGTEKNLKYYGNECNVMAEILLMRYELFVARGVVTHVTTNLNASEMEGAYGNRVRSRLREMFNLVAFERSAVDKRK